MVHPVSGGIYPRSQGNCDLNELASLLLEIEGEFLEVLGRETGERGSLRAIETKMQLRRIVGRIEGIVQGVSSQEEDPRLAAVKPLWRCFEENWETYSFDGIKKSLEKILRALRPLKSERFYEEEEKVDTQAIFRELQGAFREKDKEKIRGLLPEAAHLSMEEQKRLLREIFDFPESFEIFSSYMSHIPPQVLVDLLSYGIQQKKWDGVECFLGVATLRLNGEELRGLKESLPPDTTETIRMTLDVALQIVDTDRAKQWLAAVRTKNLEEVRHLIQSPGGLDLFLPEIQKVVEEAQGQNFLTELLSELLSYAITTQKWDKIPVFGLLKFLPLETLLKFNDQLPRDVPSEIRAIFAGAIFRSFPD